ncbi:MAG: fimbrillin family protein [Bacteroides sp.]|nr:fimbrillin family protein [Bacteroides sp.]MBQ8602743.1 fimbrillin family protein [Bacteroides sp.]
MKKTLLICLAATAMVSCSQDEVMEVAQKEAISFKDAFVENATRAAIDGSYTNAKGNLASFQVYGTTKDNANTAEVNIFNGVTVTGTQNTSWSYDNQYTQYWIEGNIYNFAAVADGNIDNVTSVTSNNVNMPTAINILDASQQKDVLYATNFFGECTATSATTVPFTFNHILSKVKFTAKVADALDSKYYYTVSNIKITNAAKKATYTIGSATPWTYGTEEDDKYTVEFGNIVETANATTVPTASQLKAKASVESNWDRLLVPEANVNIEFDVALYTENGLINSYKETISNFAVNMEGGKAYNFQFTLPVPGKKIEFTVNTITDWTNENKDLTIDKQ